MLIPQEKMLVPTMKVRENDKYFAPGPLLGEVKPIPTSGSSTWMTDIDRRAKSEPDEDDDVEDLILKTRIILMKELLDC